MNVHVLDIQRDLSGQLIGGEKALKQKIGRCVVLSAGAWDNLLPRNGD